MKPKHILLIYILIMLLALPITAVADTGDPDACDHSWDGGTVTTPATCAAEGVMTYTCTLCGATRTEAIPKTEHTPVTVPGKAATCTEAGLTEGSRCSVCDAVIQAQETIPATGHTWSDWVIRQEPTCTDGGIEAHICSVCGAEETRAADALGHAWDGGAITLEPTCAAEGAAAYTCTRCGETRTEAIARLDHTPVAVPGKAATCLETGLTEGSVCSVCGTVLQTQETIPLTDHTPVAIEGKAATCTESGLTEGSICSVCGEILQAQEPIPAAGHVPQAIPTVAATCMGTGLTEGSRCAVCGTILKAQETTLALGHDWHTATTEPVGITDGETVTTCSRCGETSRTPIPAALALFNLLRRTSSIPVDVSGLVVVQEPKGGVMPYGGAYELSVAVKGGLGGYTYEWHYRADRTRTNRDNLSRFADRVAALRSSSHTVNRSRFAYAFGAIAKRAYPDLNALDQISAYTYGGIAYQQALRPVSFYLDDHILGNSDGPTYAATQAGTYYCVIRDKAGNQVSSANAAVTCSLHIVSEPRNVNIQGRDSVTLSCAAAGGTPFEDSDAPYMYFWYKAGGTYLNQLSSTVSVSETGRYYCVVTDADDNTVTSATVTVYDAPLLTVAPEADRYRIALSNQTASITMTIGGGVTPYTCVWSLNGETVLEAFNTEETVVSYPAAELGTYYLTVTDARGQVRMGASAVELPGLAIDRQPVGGQLESGEPVEIDIVMGEGDAPFTYTLYKNGVPDGSVEGDGSCGFWVSDPGEYCIHVEDASGGHADSDRVLVTADTKPIITEQPKSVALEYREDGQYQISLSCQAVSGEGTIGALDFCWERNVQGNWYPLCYDHGGSSVFSWSGKDVPGQYRVVVTDPENGESSISHIVTADVPLSCAVTSVDTYRLDYSITGGRAPYMVKVYQRTGNGTVGGAAGVLAAACVAYESGSTGVDGSATEGTEYCVVVEDSLGWSCVSDPNGGETAQPDREGLIGDWFAQVRGLDLILTLTDDGTYTVRFGAETNHGVWTMTDAGICLDGADAPTLYLTGERLTWTARGVFLMRDQLAGSAYSPAELLMEGVAAETFNGYWTCCFLDAGGAVLPACELYEATDVYVEASRAALGGPLFGDVAVDMVFEDGALAFVQDDVSVSLALQTDGLMRMTLAAPDAALTLYLMRTQAESASPAL